MENFDENNDSQSIITETAPNKIIYIDTLFNKNNSITTFLSVSVIILFINVLLRLLIVSNIINFLLLIADTVYVLSIWSVTVILAKKMLNLPKTYEYLRYVCILIMAFGFYGYMTIISEYSMLLSDYMRITDNELLIILIKFSGALIMSSNLVYLLDKFLGAKIGYEINWKDYKLMFLVVGICAIILFAITNATYYFYGYSYSNFSNGLYIGSKQFGVAAFGNSLNILFLIALRLFYINTTKKLNKGISITLIIIQLLLSVSSIFMIYLTDYLLVPIITVGAILSIINITQLLLIVLLFIIVLLEKKLRKATYFNVIIYWGIIYVIRMVIQTIHHGTDITDIGDINYINTMINEALIIIAFIHMIIKLLKNKKLNIQNTNSLNI